MHSLLKLFALACIRYRLAVSTNIRNVVTSTEDAMSTVPCRYLRCGETFYTQFQNYKKYKPLACLSN